MSVVENITLGVAANVVFYILSVTAAYLIATFVQKRRTERQFRMMYENALVSFSGDLEKIIFTEAKNDTIKARAIVSTRDSTAENLDNLKKLLNSEIDTLKRQLETEAPEAAISETIEVLKANWFVKKNLIDTATRRILVTLGLSQIWNDRN